MSDLKLFEEIVKNPRKQMNKYLAMQRKVIGCFPLYVPEQLVYALRMIPFGMWGSEMEVKRAKNFFPVYICGILQTNLELVLKGVYDGVSAVMIPTLCDSLKCATQNWKYASSKVDMIPINYPQNRKSRGAYYFLYQQYKEIIKKLEKISGKKLDDDNLKHAIDTYNCHNHVMREFIKTAAEYPQEISPLQRNIVIKSGYFMDKKEHTKLVEELIFKIRQNKPQRFSGIRVVTTGVIADSEDLLNTFTRNKMAIVADDIAHESRQFRVDVKSTGDLVGDLVNQFLDLYGCSTLIGGEISREELLLNLVNESRADGLIILMTKFCDPEEYDYPLIKRKLDENNIPVLCVEVDKQVKNYEQAETALQTFREMIRL